jgi:PAS domain S-box-containing protein
MTERGTGHREAAHEAAFLAAIVQSSDDAIVSKDLNGVVTSWNRAAERIFGYSAEEIVGRPILLIIPQDRLDEETHILARLRSGERVDHFETVRQRKDGTLINVSVTISPVRDASGRIIGASKVARDITGQKRMEAELRRYADDLAEQHRQKDEFMAMLAHELRNPLAPMRTALEILRLRAGDPEQVRRVRETLDRQVKNLNRLVEDLLDISRITQGKMHPQFERIDLARLVRFNCQSYGVRAEAAGLLLECRGPEVPVWVLGDPTRLDQILDNLLENALKFTERGGRITVELKQEDEDTVLLVVRDTGVGMDPAMIPRLFSTFTQAEQTLARSRGGLGLGLSIVKGLAELHGGSIEASSEGLGHGAEFRLRLPAEGEPPALAEGAPSSRPTVVSRRILLVEDNKDAADSLADLLRIFGYEVRVAYTGLEGLEAAHLFRPEVVLCDIGLPGLDGYEVARRLRSEATTAEARLIAITGYGSESDSQKAHDAGFDQHLVKPVDPDRLLGEIGLTSG